MAAWDYDEALAELLKSEGGYTNHPADPGGPTNFGITIADYRMYVKPNATADDVRHMKLSEAKAIYRAKYWDKMRCDELPAGVDYAVFDFGVNSGVSRSAKYLQRIVGAKDDGVIGDKTLQSVNDYVAKYGAKKLEDTLEAQRLAFLKGLKTWSVFGGGWGTRVDKVDRIADEMERDAPNHHDAPTATPIPVLVPKPEAPKPPLAQRVDPQKQIGGLLNAIYGLVQAFLKRKS